MKYKINANSQFYHGGVKYNCLNELPSTYITSVNWNDNGYITGQLNKQGYDLYIGLLYYCGRYATSWTNRKQWKLRQGCTSTIDENGNFKILLPTLPSYFYRYEDYDDGLFLQVKLVLLRTYNDFNTYILYKDLQKQYIYNFK